MLSQLVRLALPLGLLVSCAAGGGQPAKAPSKTPEAPASTPGAPEADAAPSGLGEPPPGIPAPDASCAAFVAAAPASCAAGELDDRLALALTASGSQRDELLRCLETEGSLPAGWVLALRAELAPRECGDVIVGQAASAPGASADIADTLIALGVGARLHRSVRNPPLPRAPFDKATFLQHFKQALSPWIAAQAHAVDVLSRVGPRLRGYAKAVVALEAGLADLRFVGVARSIELPDEMQQDPEIRETYLVALEQALEPRVARGRDAALVGLGELSRLGITRDARLKEARQLLSELYAGRRIDALDRLLLPPLPTLDTSTSALKVAALLPAFYAAKRDDAAALGDGRLLRARLEQGVPPALWNAAAPTPELAALTQRALVQLGQTYFWAEPFARAARVKVPGTDASAELVTALAGVLAHGPRNAAAMMLGPPTLPAELRETRELDAIAKDPQAQYAGLAAFDAAYVRGLAPPANDPAFWKDLATRYQRARQRLAEPSAKALALELGQAAQATEKELAKQAKP